MASAGARDEDGLRSEAGKDAAKAMAKAIDSDPLPDAVAVLKIRSKLDPFADREASLSHYLEEREFLDAVVADVQVKDFVEEAVSVVRASGERESGELWSHGGHLNPETPVSTPKISCDDAVSVTNAGCETVDKKLDGDGVSKMNAELGPSAPSCAEESETRCLENASVSVTSESATDPLILPYPSQASSLSSLHASFSAKLSSFESYFSDDSRRESPYSEQNPTSLSPTHALIPAAAKLLNSRSPVPSTEKSYSRPWLSVPSSPTRNFSETASDLSSLLNEDVDSTAGHNSAHPPSNPDIETNSTLSKTLDAIQKPKLESYKPSPPGYSKASPRLWTDLYSPELDHELDFPLESSITQSPSSFNGLQNNLMDNVKSNRNSQPIPSSSKGNSDISLPDPRLRSTPKPKLNASTSFKKPNSRSKSLTDFLSSKSFSSSSFSGSLDAFPTESHSKPTFVPAQEPVSSNHPSISYSISTQRSTKNSKINVKTYTKQAINPANTMQKSFTNEQSATTRSESASVSDGTAGRPKTNNIDLSNANKIPLKMLESHTQLSGSIRTSRSNLHSKVEPDSDSEPDSDFYLRSDFGPSREFLVEVNSGPKPEAQSETSSDSKFEAVINPNPETIPALNSENETQNAVQPETYDATIKVPDCYLVVHNVAKRHNLGTLIRSASAFNVKEMILVGRRDFNSFGSHGSADFVSFRHFSNLNDARTYLKGAGCDICGVEIMESALSITSHPFKKSTAFLLGNEGTGLSQKEISFCDFFVYIPQYGSGTASLNVAIAASIILHNFAVWAGYTERVRSDQKFVVGERPMRKSSRNICPMDPSELQGLRKQKAEMAKTDWVDLDTHDDATGNESVSHPDGSHPQGSLHLLFESET